MMASGACSRDLVYFTFGDAVSNAQVIQQITLCKKGLLFYGQTVLKSSGIDQNHCWVLTIFEVREKLSPFFIHQLFHFKFIKFPPGSTPQSQNDNLKPSLKERPTQTLKEVVYALT